MGPRSTPRTLASPRRAPRLLVSLLLLLLAVAPLGAQQPGAALPQFVGPPSAVHDAEPGDQPVVAMDADGDFVVVWHDRRQEAVIAQRFDERGRRVGGLINVSDADTRPLGNDRIVDVAMSPGGAFVVVWAGGSEPSGIFARRFDAGGTSIGTRVSVTGGSSDGVSEPVVAMGPGGDFAVVWLEETIPFPELPSITSLLLRRYGADGLAVEGSLTTLEPASAGAPAIAADGAGNLVIAWTRGPAVLARRYLAESGVFRDVLLPPDSGSEPDRGLPAVAAEAGGAFAIAWYDGQRNQLEAQRYSSDGSAVGLPLRLDSNEFVNSRLGVALPGQGSLAGAWDEEESDAFGVRLSLFGPAAVEPPQPVWINGDTYATRLWPDLAASRVGDLVVVWEANSIANGEFPIEAERAYFRLLRRPTVEATQTNSSTMVLESSQLGDPVTLSLRTVPTSTVTVTLTPDSDQISLGLGAGVPVTRTFPVGATRPISVTVFAVDDQIAEGPHTASVQISSASADPAYDGAGPQVTVDDVLTQTVVVSITDNDLVAYGVSTGIAGTTETNPAPIRFRITRDGATAGSSSVGYSLGGTAIFGADYRLAGGRADVVSATGTLAFGPGERERTIELLVIDDRLGEPNKSIVLALHSPLPAGASRLGFPVATVTLSDDDPAAVQVTQSGGSTVVTRGGRGDTLLVALRTAPTAPVTVTLTPTSRQINLGAGWGIARQLIFEPDESATRSQRVRVHAVNDNGQDNLLAVGTAIQLAAASADPAYDRGARFTVDGLDRADVPVQLNLPPGSGPDVTSVYLPVVVR